jgi:hypothetical protein
MHTFHQKIFQGSNLSQTMAAEKSTKFIKREVDADYSRIFESRVSEINGSIIAFAYGTRIDGSPNVIGTGFSVAMDAQKNVGFFATCLHVMKEIAELRDLCETQLEKEGLIDKKRRIAFLNDDTYEWKEVGKVRYSDKMQNEEGNFVQTHDVCICRIPDFILPQLCLSPDEYFMGSELGIIGFPNFEHLQRISV